MISGFDFEGKVVLVTGGTRGIGRGLCEGFLELGARVFTCGRKEERLEETREAFLRYGERFEALRCDVTNSSELRELFKIVEEKESKLDVLINNVGMNRFTPFLLDADEATWDRIMAGNLKSAFLVTKMALPLLKSSQGAKVINISSIAGRRASPGMGIYSIAKAGLDMFTKVLGAELASYGINVNAVAPGVVRTDFSKPLWSQPEMLKEIESHIPMARIGEIEEVVGAVIFLSSPMANYITGEVFVVDGGAQVW